MKIVVDTNIIFSALLNTNSKIGDLLLDPESKFDFYSCIYMRTEILKHWEKFQNFRSNNCKHHIIKLFRKLLL